MLVLGIDVGTQGARVVACDARGDVVAQAAESFPKSWSADLPPGWAEQDAETWWTATTLCLRRVLAEAADAGFAAAAVEAISLTSTSGTILPVDEQGAALRPAMMYNDSRAGAEAVVVQAAGRAQAERLGYRFSSSFALSKILWLQNHEPQICEQTRAFIHAADFIVGRLTDQYDLSDFSNSLKTGYDLQNDCWPDFIESELGIPVHKLPRVQRPGAILAAISPACADETGLPAGIPVLAGMSDGCASQISTGAVSPGDWNSTLGTTLVVKGVTETLLTDPFGRIYSHRHPDGFWLPGGASNTGGEAIAKRFPRGRWDDLNARAQALTPSDVILYPLARRGERFPFANAAAEGFAIHPTDDEAASYTAHLEGIAYLERLSYDMLAGLGAQIGDTIYSAGGATHSPVWSQIRADILGRALVRPEVTGGAMGAAILAASGTWYDGLIPAARAMVRIIERIEPRPEYAAAYDERYQQFRAACAERGYIEA